MTKHTAVAVPRCRLSRRWQWCLMFPIAVHLAAVFSEPFHFFSRSEVQTGADAEVLRSGLHAYSQWMYLDHGYFFFAPNPGPGHLLRISASDDPLPLTADEKPNEETRNTEVVVNTLPDRKSQVPRLLYHRYFMLSEFYYNRYAPFELSQELSRDSEFLKRWQSDRRIYTAIQQSIVSHTKHKTGKAFVRLDRLERTLPDRVSILKKGIRLTDPQWLSVLPETMPDAPLTPLPFDPARTRNESDALPQEAEKAEAVPARELPGKEKGR